MAGEAQDDVLPLSKLKQALSLCEKKPLGCAFGLTKDKKECILLVDKVAKPKKAASLMKASGKAHLDAPTLRFGLVEVDVENDPGTLRFTVNRSEAGGTVTTLSKLAKRAGYSAIVINADDSLEKEAEEEGAPPPPPPAPVAQPQADPAQLKARLTELVKQMMERLPKDPANQAKLTQLAKTANVQLGTNNFKTAVELMDGLEKMLSVPLPPAAPPPPSAGAGTVAFAKARLAWLATRGKIEADLDTLRDAIQNYYKDDSVGRRIDKAYQSRVKPMLQVLDESLADTLDAARNATDPDKRAKLVQQARDKLKNYQGFIATDSLFQAIDSNPFVPLTTAKNTTATLVTLAAAVR